MLITRTLSSLVLIPIVLGLTYLGGPYFGALVLVVALLAGHEFYRVMSAGGFKPFYGAGLALIVLLNLDAYFSAWGIWRWGIAATVMLPMVWQILHPDSQGFLTRWALTLTGALYVGGLLAHMISLRNLPQGLGWILLTFAVTWTCDSSAYLAGTRWGKHGFFTHISPHKTWEGAMAGCAFGVLAAVIAGHWLGLAVWQRIALGVPLVLGVILGDLAESLVKRQVGVKDSGALIPGHGGMLDRVDSLLFAGAIVYYFVQWVVL